MRLIISCYNLFMLSVFAIGVSKKASNNLVKGEEVTNRFIHHLPARQIDLINADLACVPPLTQAGRWLLNKAQKSLGVLVVKGTASIFLSPLIGPAIKIFSINSSSPACFVFSLSNACQKDTIICILRMHTCRCTNTPFRLSIHRQQSCPC